MTQIMKLSSIVTEPFEHVPKFEKIPCNLHTLFDSAFVKLYFVDDSGPAPSSCVVPKYARHLELPGFFCIRSLLLDPNWSNSNFTITLAFSFVPFLITLDQGCCGEQSNAFISFLLTQFCTHLIEGLCNACNQIMSV